MTDAEIYLERWQKAGLLDSEQTAKIRAFETGKKKPAHIQLQAVIALIFGAILLGGGVLLFVAAHWDSISPLARFTLVLCMLPLFHGLGLFFVETSPRVASALHAVGTVAAGAGIALTGQIFNINEHWPAAILLWAIAAGAGWYLLRDQFQQTFTLLLVPAWILSEWSFRAENFKGNDVFLARMLMIIGAVYLTACLHDRRRALRNILMTVGSLALVVGIAILAYGWQAWGKEGMIPTTLQIAAWIIMLLFIVGGAFSDRRTLVPLSVALAVVLLLPHCQHLATSSYGSQFAEPSVAAYLLIAAFAAFFAWWGVNQASTPLINLGVLGFATTVLWFYFSSLMDKLGRSLGLIVLGILFLGGGWLLEKIRRRLTHSLHAEVR
jgi:uncharacterized membrane protein